MTTRSRRRFWQARANVAWAMVALVVIQLGFVLAIDLCKPELYDPEFGIRLRLLQTQVREHPDRPLLVVVGSSRIGAGFMPQEMPPLKTADGRLVLPFNWSHLAAGPRINLLQIRRLLREGLTPSWVVLEIVPGGLGHDSTPASLAAVEDLPVLWRYPSRCKDTLVYLRNRLNPFYNYRQDVLRRVAPPFVTQADPSDVVNLLPLGDDNNWIRHEFTSEIRATQETVARSIYYDALQTFQVDPQLDRATCEVLDLCRQRGIPLVLIATPENSLFRSWYSAETEKRLGDYLDRLGRSYNVAVVDARTWVSDDGFNDPHHLGLRGARVFTERLHRQVLEPLVLGSVSSYRPVVAASGSPDR
jgi:hypothetical protein